MDVCVFVWQTCYTCRGSQRSLTGRDGRRFARVPRRFSFFLFLFLSPWLFFHLLEVRSSECARNTCARVLLARAVSFSLLLSLLLSSSSSCTGAGRGCCYLSPSCSCHCCVCGGRRARRSDSTWRSVRSSQLCRMSQAGSTRPSTLVTENKSREEHLGNVQPSGQRTSANCEIRAALLRPVCCFLFCFSHRCFPVLWNKDKMIP